MIYIAYLINPLNESYQVEIEADTPEEAKVKARREYPSSRVAQILKEVKTN